MNGRADRFRLLLTVLLAALLVISAAFLLWGWLTGRFSSVEGMREYIGTFGLLGPVVLTVIQALQVVLPGFFGCIAGASLFGADGHVHAALHLDNRLREALVHPGLQPVFCVYHKMNGS